MYTQIYLCVNTIYVYIIIYLCKNDQSMRIHVGDHFLPCSQRYHSGVVGEVDSTQPKRNRYTPGLRCLSRKPDKTPKLTRSMIPIELKTSEWNIMEHQFFNFV